MGKEVFMDTKVFTGIVNNIGAAASECVFGYSSRDHANVAWDGTEVGKEIIGIMEQMHKTVRAYRSETAGALPQALLTLRDGLINVDDSLSKGIEIERIK